ncbi:MAG: hypothetical protein GXP27_21400, partial [Planctomycetes bacterium]|nr:hypothetical protein [Planctomycetota bacterium]
ALYYLHLATRTARLQSYERVLAPRAKEWIPKFRDRWGLAAWSLTEEITPEIVAELGPYYRLVRELAPNQPPTVLHNNFPAALADLKQNRPAVITHDFYPFFWSPRSGPSNPRRSVAALRAGSRFYKACREHWASLWMMVQAWGTPERRPLDPPHYGYRTGMRTPEPGEIKLQGWVSVAEGATGLFFYAALPSRPEEHQLWDFGWKETARTRAAGELFEQLQRVAPLLCRLERDYAEAGFVSTSNPKVIAHTFVRRKDSDNTGRPAEQTRRPSDLPPARYIVLASLDGFEPQRFNLSVQTDQRVFDLISRRDITDQLTDMVLPPGEGRVLLVGSRDDFHQTCRLIDSDGTRSQ